MILICEDCSSWQYQLDIIKKVTYLTPNEHEASLIFGEKESEDELLKEYPEKLIITKGSRGVAACLKNSEVVNIPSIKSMLWIQPEQAIL